MDWLGAVRQGADRYGALVLAGLVARPAVDAVVVAWELEARPFTGDLPRQRGQRVEPHRYDAAGRVANPVANPRLTDLPEFSGTEERLMRGGPVVAAAEAMLGEPVALLQATFAETSVGVGLHRDLHPIAPGEPICAILIALETITPEAGGVWFHAGSHALPADDPDVVAFDGFCRAAWYATYVEDREPHGLEAWDAVRIRLQQRYALELVRPVLNAGDALCWLGPTWHGSEVPTVADRRRSVILHFVPLRTVADRTDGP